MFAVLLESILMKRNYVITAILAGTMLILLLGSEYIFGRDNLVVGIIFSLALVIINALDVRTRPLTLGAMILSISLALGVVAWVAGFSLMLTIVITFAVIFLSTYFLFGDFQAQLYLPIVAGYLYLISDPGSPDRLPYRFFALATGALVISTAWWLIVYLKKRESISNLFDRLIGEVAQHATATAGSSEIEFVPTPIPDILEQINEINQHLYAQPVRSHEMSAILEMRISLILTLERLIMAIGTLRIDHEPSPVERQCLADLAGLLEEIRQHPRDLKRWRALEPDVQAFSSKYRALIDSSDAETSTILFEVVSAVDVLSGQIDILRNLWDQDKVERNEVGDMFWARELSRIVRPNSLRRTFAFKYAIALTLTVLAGFFIPWSLFKWTGWTIAFLVKPYVEDTDRRSRLRIIGTIVGISVFTLLLAIVTDNTALMVFGMAFQILAFLLPFNTYPQTIIATLGTLTLVSLASNETGWLLSLERVAFVLLGAVIAVIVTRFIFPYRVTIASVDLVERSRHLSYLMLKKVLSTRIADVKTGTNHPVNDEAKRNIKGTALAINIIEHQLMLNNQIREFEQINQFVKTQHELVNDIYFFFASFPHMPEEHEAIDRVMIKLNDLITRIDHELVRQEGRHTRYGGPDFYAMTYSYLDELEALQRRIDAAFAYVDDEDSKLSLNALGNIVEKIKAPFEHEWVISQLA